MLLLNNRCDRVSSTPFTVETFLLVFLFPVSVGWLQQEFAVLDDSSLALSSFINEKGVHFHPDSSSEKLIYLMVELADYE
jgi:hypothetical protein